MDNELHIFFRLSNYDNESNWVIDPYYKEVIKICEQNKYKQNGRFFMLNNSELLDFLTVFFSKQNKLTFKIEKSIENARIYLQDH